MHIARIVSGGQTGADRAALDAALHAGIPYGGWCPAGGLAEDHPAPPGLLADYPALREAPSGDPAVRTRLNVRGSDATLVVREAVRSPGTDLTLALAEELGRPCLVTAGDTDAVTAWLEGLALGLTLNVAGPRESEQPGSYAATRALLEQVLERNA
ncbi:YpsA SLOG family protein [Nocardioides sp. Root140]|uniref:YpsA SLOG family protein n=1 Tax=Nocardioides sp. Root140 TaxID=1736460 RepID=UPI0006F6545B|nr:putative molybdenum carrier protein [Nocardioides sp. Root140]KQY62416.1 hypothetical protein ASD30_23905 [Nocardioides sp. Root140]